jgi:two-component system, chemotaxis family, CheB/CheR fusion protein
MPSKKEKPESDPKAALKTDPEGKGGKTDDDFPIVGIGASAGGLETLGVFFSQVPEGADIAFVVIQHLSPKHESMMAELLAKHTHMPVRQIDDGVKVSPGCVYLNPPNKNVAVFNRRIHLMEPVQGDTVNMPIDFFFRSLSEDQKEKAIGIIVSGTASDGTLGIKAIKGEGGMAMAQDPATAKYDGMPKSAIHTGMVDFVVPVEKMPQTLLNYIAHPFLNSPEKIAPGGRDYQQEVGKIFSLIRSATGHDFSQYKPNTIQRRIERRLAVHQLEKLSDYVLYLQKTPEEVAALFKDLLIGVTSFFRDPDAFKALEQEGLEKIVRHKKNDELFRCWVVGCSTGEEAYSLAILLAEAMERLDKRFEVQMFASDIDEKAIETARRGIYPDSIAADVSKDRLKRFFSKETNAYRVKKKIRDMVVFSPHNVIKDPPFSKLDLVSCRNLLIYLSPSLQKKVIPLFHYSLRPEGILFLGTSETIGEFTDLFESLERKWKVYRSKEDRSGKIIDYPLQSTVSGRTRIPSSAAPEMAVDLQALAEKAILREYAPAGVVIDGNFDIVHFVGKTERYLVSSSGKPSFNIMNMARRDLKPHLTTALQEVSRQKKRATRKGIRVGHNGGVSVIDLSISPLDHEAAAAEFFLVIFESKAPEQSTLNEPKKGVRKGSKDSKIRKLEEDLQSTREYLQATIEELETANEELKSTNEELQSVNEELQSSNEELETSKEELQSTNEELNTVNAELQNKVQELSMAGDDLNNLLAATDIATIFLDTRLRIKRYTPAVARIVKMIPTDVGRPLTDLKTSFPDFDFAQRVKRVLEDLQTLETEIMSEDHIWYQLKAVPYRTTNNVIEGVVVTLINIQKQVRETDEKLRRFAAVLEDSNDAITVLGFDGRILAWNKGAEALYGWNESEALKMKAWQLAPKEDRKDLKALMERIKKGDPVRSFKSRRKTKEGKILEVWMTVTALTDKDGRPVEIATTERDLAWLTEG